MTKGKKILTILAVIIVLLVSAFIWLGWSGSTKDIEAVADQFKPDSSWKNVNSYVNPPRFVCVDEVCPSLGRTWTTPQNVTQDEVLEIVSKSGWSGVRSDEDCLARRNQKVTLLDTCPLYGSVNGYKVSIYVDDNDPIYKSPSVSIYLKK